jgi:hypothetical protein
MVRLVCLLVVLRLQGVNSSATGHVRATIVGGEVRNVNMMRRSNDVDLERKIRNRIAPAQPPLTNLVLENDSNLRRRRRRHRHHPLAEHLLKRCRRLPKLEICLNEVRVLVRGHLTSI